ncbi:MAG: SDR family oxidoreductase [Bacteriovoracaceae bacterium]|nr:SDR family oxidoreductase [Bacteriovoracaceae bacterium]
MNYEQLVNHLKNHQYKWGVTGVAGFIGSHILEELLNLGQKVIGIDNFSTGTQKNLDYVLDSIDDHHKENFTFIRGDLQDQDLCGQICEYAEFILHQGALGSVPRSLNSPRNSHNSNVNGQFNLLVASQDSKIKSFVYASSSSVYGDNQNCPKKEDCTGKPLSPYAATKKINEIYGQVFSDCYKLNIRGLRYFNVFGPRQNPNGPYAAVIPIWIRSLIRNEEVYIFGDGSTSRDFCYVKNAVQANLLAAFNTQNNIGHEIYNIACGRETSLNDLFSIIKTELSQFIPDIKNRGPLYKDFREGDIKNTLASINKGKKDFNYDSPFSINEGLKETINWFYNHQETYT